MKYIAMFIFVAFSAFFSGSEIAYASANRMRLKKNAERGGLKDRLALYIYDHYNNTLSTILIGNNLANIATSSLATVIAVELVGDVGAVYATIAMTVLILIFGEIVPKILAQQHADTYARTVAAFLRLLMYLFSPVVWLVTRIVNLFAKLWHSKAQVQGEGLTAEELVSIIETGEDEGVIDEEQSDLLQSALEFSEISVLEILIPRVDMLAIDIDDDLDAINEVCMNSHYSRIPVFEKSVDNIIGVLYLNRYFKARADGVPIDLRAMLIETCYVHKNMKLPAALAELKRRKLHLAIVTDEYGGTMGLITMEDILEQLVGDIWDESDVVYTEIHTIDTDTYEVEGDMTVWDLFEHLDVDDRNFESEYTTVGGWAIEMLGGFPQPGESFGYENLMITVKELEEQRVAKLQVQVLPRKAEDE